MGFLSAPDTSGHQHRCIESVLGRTGVIGVAGHRLLRSDVEGSLAQDQAGNSLLVSLRIRDHAHLCRRGSPYAASGRAGARGLCYPSKHLDKGPGLSKSVHAVLERGAPSYEIADQQDI